MAGQRGRSIDRSRVAVQTFAWGPAAAWAAVLFLLSAQSELPIGDLWIDVPDWAAHFGVYTVLGAALAHARFHGARRVPHVAMIALGAIYGVTDEWHQRFVPGRVPSADDWIFDLAGTAIGYGVAWLVATRLLGGGEDSNETDG